MMLSGLCCQVSPPSHSRGTWASSAGLRAAGSHGQCVSMVTLDWEAGHCVLLRRLRATRTAERGTVPTLIPKHRIGDSHCNKSL